MPLTSEPNVSELALIKHNDRKLIFHSCLVSSADQLLWLSLQRSHSSRPEHLQRGAPFPISVILKPLLTLPEETLVYQCNCANNKSAPALQYYQNTIPTFLCEQTFADCNANNVGNKAGQDACAEDRAANCGTLNPENYTSGAATTTISSATQSSTSAAGGSSSNVASTVSTTSSKGIAMPTMAATFGSGVVAAGMAAAFGLLL